MSMKEEKKQLYREIKELNAEVLDQAAEHADAKELLVRARDELEKVLQSKKAILTHLQKALLKLEEKNKVLLVEREAEHEKSEQKLMKNAELLSMEKQIQQVNRLSALWDESLENLRREVRALEQEKRRLQDKMDKLVNEGGMLEKATQSTEQQIRDIDARLGGLTSEEQGESARNREPDHEVLHAEEEQGAGNHARDVGPAHDEQDEQNRFEEGGQRERANRRPPHRAREPGKRDFAREVG